MNLFNTNRRRTTGLDLPGYKFTAGTPVEAMPLPARVVLPLGCCGQVLTLQVKKGDKVKAGQPVAAAEDPLLPPVLASISGEVTATPRYLDPVSGAPAPALEITSDGQDEQAAFEAGPDLAETARRAGILGLGGANFPLNIKLTTAGESRIRYLIINALESEPFITADYRLMAEHGPEVLSGIGLLRQYLKPERTILAVSSHYPAAVKNLKQLAAGMKAGDRPEVVAMNGFYPAGAEELLVKAVCGAEIPAGGLPRDAGASVHNVSTVKALHDAAVSGRPMLERIVTVSGRVQKRTNLRVRLGTPLKDVLEYCRHTQRPDDRIVLGGPMMGTQVSDTTVPLTAAVTGVVVLGGADSREQACIRCGRCLEVCPVYLSPVTFFHYSRAGRYQECLEAGLEVCFDCGNCTYICPSRIQLGQYIRVAKRELARRQEAAA